MDIGFPAPSYLPSFVQKRLGEANTSMSHVNVEHHTSSIDVHLTAIPGDEMRGVIEMMWQNDI